MIRARGNSWQVDVMVNGKRMRRSVSSYAKARDMEIQLKGPTIESQLPKEPEPSDNRRSPVRQAPEYVALPTMKDMLELTWFRNWSRQKDGNESKRRSLAVLEDMGWLDLKPAEITKKSLLHLIDFYLHKGNSNATINRKVVAVTKLLSTALDEELIHHKPPVRLLKERNVRTRFITSMEEEAILYWLRELNYEESWHLTRFLIDTGCRLGEALSLPPQNVGRKSKSVLFEDTKNGESRRVPLTDRALESVLKWGEKLDGMGFYNRFVRARDYAGIGADVTPHTLRHTCASRLVQSGVSMAIIRVWLGHKSLQMTDRYAHLDVSNLANARNALNNFTDTE